MRVAVMAFTGSGGLLLQLQKLTPSITLSRAKTLMCGATAGYMVTLLLITSVWGFPIPFVFNIGVAPFASLQNGLTLLVIGTRDKVQLAKFTQFNNIIATQGSMLLIYPTYNYIFLGLKGANQAAFVLLLPVIKIVLKTIVEKLASDLDDLARAVVSAVNLFDALYMTKCMQSGTIWVGCGIILIDLVHNFMALRKLKKHCRAVVMSRGWGSDGDAAPVKASTDLLRDLSQSLKAIPDPSAKTKKAHNRPPSLKKCPVAAVGTTQDSLATAGKAPPSEVESANGSAAGGSGSPMPDTVDNTSLLQDTTRLLHQTEKLMVVEFIEAIVSICYTIYLVIIFNLPNAKYYEDVQHMTAHKMMSILIYTPVELLSLLHVHHMLKREFQISAFSQLAFTLEREWRIFQGNFVAWTLLVFQLLLAHDGVDFSFQFKWLHENS